MEASAAVASLACTHLSRDSFNQKAGLSIT